MCGLHAAPSGGVQPTGSALSVLSLFFDLAVGLAGPVMGFVAAGFGLQAVFLVAGLLSTGGLWLVWRLRRAG